MKKFIGDSRKIAVILIGICLWLFWAGSSGASGQSHRFSIDLNGQWQVRELSAGKWQPVAVPGHFPGKGTFVFRRSFTLPENAQDLRCQMLLEGVNFAYKLRVNSQYLAVRNFGFLPLTVLVPADVLHFHSPNMLEIEVNTERDFQSIPIKVSLFQPDFPKGIFRDLKLRMLPSTAILDAWLSHFERSAGGATLQLTAVVGTVKENANRAESLPTRLSIQVLEQPQSQTVLASHQVELAGIEGLSDTLNVTLSVPELRPWSPRNPHRYGLRLMLTRGGQLLDSYALSVGIREVNIQNGALLVNGRPVVLRASTLMEHTQTILDTEKFSWWLNKLRELHLNTILWHTPPSDRLLSMADSAGVFSILQVPLHNVPGGLLGDNSLLQDAGLVVRELGKLARHHPSVIAISLASGLDARDAQTLEFLSVLREQIPTRRSFLVTAGFRVIEPAAQRLPLDFVCLDLTGANARALGVWLDRWAGENPKLPLMVTDIGIPCLGRNSQSSQNETRQAVSLKALLETVAQRPHLGIGFRNLRDWPGSYSSLLSFWNTDKQFFPFGLARSDGSPRMAWNMVQNINAAEGEQFTLADVAEDKRGEYLFLITGLVLSAYFLFFFQGDYRFRGTFARLLTRPFGFHMELKEGRKVPFTITLRMFLLIALIWASILSSYFYVFRENPIFDFALAMMTPGESVHRLLIYLAWKPLWAVLAFAAVFMVLSFLLMGYVRLLALFSRTRISLRNAMTFVVWEGCIFVFLLPLAIVWVRLLQYSILFVPLLIFVLIFLIWYVYRLIKGFRTMFAFRPAKTVLSIMVFPCLFLALILFFYDMKAALFDHITYWLHVWTLGL